MADKSPGAAWVKKGNSWVKPPEPNDGFPHSWSDDLGWQASVMNLGGNTGSDSGWTAAMKASFDVSGLGIPGHATGSMTGDQIYQAFNAIAHSKNIKSWLAIRAILKDTVPGYTAKDLKYNWTSQDSNALKQKLSELHNASVSLGDKSTFKTYLVDQHTLATKSGINFATINAKTTKAPSLVSVPATPDLMKAANDAFTTTLGRAASPEEQAAFSKDFQSLVSQYASGKSKTTPAEFSPAPTQPTMGNPTPQVATPITLPAGQVMEPPNANVAAANYAAQQNPVNAHAQAAADGLQAFLGMLKG